MVGAAGIEPATIRTAIERSTTELYAHFAAHNRDRTSDHSKFDILKQFDIVIYIIFLIFFRIRTSEFQSDALA